MTSIKLAPPSPSARLIVLITLAVAATASAQVPGWLPLQIRSSEGYLGLRPADIDEDRAKALKLSDSSGVEVTAVQDGAAAYAAGIRPGDVLLSYNGEKLLGAQQLIRLVSETPPGKRVIVAFFRAGKQKSVLVTTGSRPPLVLEGVESFPSARVTDIPSTIMLWRNLLLGIESESISEQMEQALGVKQGVLVWNVLGGSPAQHAGLRAGDVLTGVCGHAIHSPREVGLALGQMQNDSKPVPVDLIRNHKPMSVSVLLDSPLEH